MPDVVVAALRLLLESRSYATSHSLLVAIV